MRAAAPSNEIPPKSGNAELRGEGIAKLGRTKRLIRWHDLVETGKVDVNGVRC
jgi:hypothetical protein